MTYKSDFGIVVAQKERLEARLKEAEELIGGIAEMWKRIQSRTPNGISPREEEFLAKARTFLNGK